MNLKEQSMHSSNIINIKFVRNQYKTQLLMDAEYQSTHDIGTQVSLKGSYTNNIQDKLNAIDSATVQDIVGVSVIYIY